MGKTNEQRFAEMKCEDYSSQTSYHLEIDSTEAQPCEEDVLMRIKQKRNNVWFS